MGSKTDFLHATLGDALLPILRNPMQDIVLETLDQRQVPNRTDFKELRDLVNGLRGQLGGATAGIKKIGETLDELEDRLRVVEEQHEALREAQVKLADRLQPLVQELVEQAVQKALASSVAPAAAGKSRSAQKAARGTP